MFEYKKEKKAHVCLICNLASLTWLREEAQQRKMVLVIVFIALFLDHMLLSVVGRFSHETKIEELIVLLYFPAVS